MIEDFTMALLPTLDLLINTERWTSAPVWTFTPICRSEFSIMTES